MKQTAFDLGDTDQQPEAPDDFPSLEGVKEVGFDTETTGLRWWGFDRPVGLSIAWQRPGETAQSRYLPWDHRGGGNHQKAKVREWMLRELRGKKLLGLNLKFDAHMIRAGFDLNLADDLGCTLGDVGFYAALIDDHRQRFNLETLAQDCLGVGKVPGIDPEQIADLPAWRVAEYARQDARLVVQIMNVQARELDGQDLWKVAAVEDAALPATIEMERNGARIDVERLRRWDRDTDNALTAMLMRLHAEVGFHVSPSSPGDLERLFSHLGVRSDEKTEGGAPSYSDAVLARLAQSSPVIARVRAAAHLEDLRAKYIVPYARTIGADEILRFSLNQLRSDNYGTVSGRYSASQPVRGEGANVQQVMSTEKQLKMHCPTCASAKKVDYDAHVEQGHPEAYVIRSLFIPEDGRLLLGSDAKQIEYRIFAHMANSRAILDVFAKNPEADFHQVVCDMVQAYQPGFSRKNSKGLNFALLFGAGVGKTAEILGVDDKTAKRLREAYFEAFPEARRLMDLAVETAETRGYVKTVLGRRTRFPGKERTHKALNGAVQGSAADVNKVKLAELYRERHRLGLTMRMTIHDEFVGDVQDREAARQVAALLDTQSIPFRVPILWDTKTAPNWAGCK